MKRFGREISRLRAARGLDKYVAAKAVGVCSQHLYSIERGAKTCGAGLAVKLADLFELTGDERDAFLAMRTEIPKRVEETTAPRPKRLPIAPVTCAGGCNHDGRLAPGGSVDGEERAGDCMHYSACLGVFTKKHTATKCHCPPACTYRRQEVPMLQAAAGWGSFTFPSHGEGTGRNAR